MQNYPYPFNQKEHIFDFKVKVNFENGNVSLTAPQIVTPPTRFGSQPVNYQPTAPIYTQSTYNYNESSTIQQPMMIKNNYPSSIPQNHQLSSFQSPVNHNNLFPNKVQNIELVNSSYASIKQNGDYSSVMNNSMQAIQCVLCQKSFSAVEFDQHLQLHRNRNNRTQLSTNQKNNASNYAMTQNSFNNNNDSIMSGQQGNLSFQNQSYHSNGVGSLHNGSGFVPNFTPVNQQNNTSMNNQFQSHSINQSSHLLGRIDNPILAINAAQQSNMSLNSSSQHHTNSLNYSNSHNQSTTRFKDPNQFNSIQQSPNFNQVDNSNGSSFGHHGGNNLIGPSFYHNSSQESGTNTKNGPFVKGINRLAYNDVNNSHNSHQSLAQGQVINMMAPNLLLPNQNESYHSNYSQPSHYSNGSHHSQQYIHPQSLNASQQQNVYLPQNNSNSFRNDHNSMQSYHSYQSNHSLQNNNFIPPDNNNMMMQNFQTIESRYLNQPVTNSRQLYASQQQLNSGYGNQPQMRNSRNGSRQYEDGLFNQNDISSISGSSRKDISEYSDWSDFNQRQQQKLQGYNSADNSLIKHMQQRKQDSQKINNIYLDKSDNKNNTEEKFFKKKKDHMINSATSYYDKKFKDQEYSSSDDQYVNNTGRLSYAERLKEKRVTDNSRPVDLTNTKSGRLSKNLKQSSRSNNMSKYSQYSSLSKTKLPVNYLARQEFISTSSTSKSTHKTSLPN